MTFLEIVEQIMTLGHPEFFRNIGNFGILIPAKIKRKSH